MDTTKSTMDSGCAARDILFNQDLPRFGKRHTRAPMLTHSAEDSFQKGLEAFTDGRRKEAMALFEAAIELERRFGQDRPQARYLSYYGVCLGLEKNDLRESLRFCREAVTIEGYNPDIRCNLGRVLLRAGRRKEAYVNFVRGLRVEPRHGQTLKSLKQLGVRRRPVVPFLDRGNPVNVLLGRMRVRG
jgi:tetratricopeptide (TPR) repeat protein